MASFAFTLALLVSVKCTSALPTTSAYNASLGENFAVAYSPSSGIVITSKDSSQVWSTPPVFLSSACGTWAVTEYMGAFKTRDEPRDPTTTLSITSFKQITLNAITIVGKVGGSTCASAAFEFTLSVTIGKPDEIFFSSSRRSTTDTTTKGSHNAQV